MGTPGYDASVDYVAGVLRAAGYDVQTPEFAAAPVLGAGAAADRGRAALPALALGYSPATPAGGVNAPLAVVDRRGCDAAALAGVPAGVGAADPPGNVHLRREVAVAGRRRRGGAVWSTTRTAR